MAIDDAGVKRAVAVAAGNIGAASSIHLKKRLQYQTQYKKYFKTSDLWGNDGYR